MNALQRFCWLAGLLAAVSARDIYVSPNGHDKTKCGSYRSPCKSIQHSIDLSKPNDVISLDSTNGSFTSGADYVIIPHDLTVRATSGEAMATIECGGLGNGVFNITGNRTAGDLTSKTLSVTLSNIRIRNCNNRTVPDRGAILLRDASLELSNCTFTSNGIVVGHPQISQKPPGCRFVSLRVTNSEFHVNGVPKPYFPAVSLLGCDTVNMHVTASKFTSSPLRLYPEGYLSLSLDQILVDGRNVRGASLAVTLGRVSSNVSLSNSIITGHRYTKASPITIYTYNKSKISPNINVKNVTFSNNVLTKDDGGVLSTIAPFAQTGESLDVTMTFLYCRFLNNSAQGTGGALYLKNVANVQFNQCEFHNNTAAEGGAMAITSGHHVTVTNSNFTANTAVDLSDASAGQGGAVKAVNSDLLLHSCSFLHNAGRYEGTALYVENAQLISLQSCYFETATTEGTASFDSLVSIRTALECRDQNTSGISSISNNVFNVSQSEDTLVVLDVSQPTMTASGNHVSCPRGFVVPYTVVKLGSTRDTHATVACKPCPLNTYNTQAQILRGALSQKHSHGSNGTCYTCPRHGQCSDGKLLALPGYWGQQNPKKHHKVSQTVSGGPHIAPGPVDFYLCPYNFCPSEAMSHANYSETPHCQNYSCCQGNRSGTLCGECKADKYSYLLGHGTCVLESDCDYGMKAAVGFCVLFAALYFGITMALSCLISVVRRKQEGQGSLDPTQERPNTGGIIDGRNAPDVDAEPDIPDPPPQFEPAEDLHGLLPHPDEATTQEAVNQLGCSISMLTDVSTLVTDVVIATQLTGLAYGFPLSPQGLPLSIAAIPLSLCYLQTPFFMFSKLCSLGRQGAAGEVALRLSSSAFLVFIYVMASALWELVSCCKKRFRRDNPNRDTAMGDAVYGSFYVILALTSVPLLHSSLVLVQCVPVGNATVLYMAGGMECQQPWQTALAVYMGLALAPMGATLWAGIYLSKREFISRRCLLLAPVFSLLLLIRWFWLFGFRLVIHAMTSPSIANVQRPIQVTGEHLSLSCQEEGGLNPCITRGPSPARGSVKGNNRGGPLLLMVAVFITTLLASLLTHVPITRALTLTALLTLILFIRHKYSPFWTYSSVRLGFLANAIWWIIPIISLLTTCNAVVYELGAEPYLPLDQVQLATDWLFTGVVLVSNATILVAILTILVLVIKTRSRQ